jgi:hypothetical protein
MATGYSPLVKLPSLTIRRIALERWVSPICIIASHLPVFPVLVFVPRLPRWSCTQLTLLPEEKSVLSDAVTEVPEGMPLCRPLRVAISADISMLPFFVLAAEWAGVVAAPAAVWKSVMFALLRVVCSGRASVLAAHDHLCNPVFNQTKSSPSFLLCALPLLDLLLLLV